MKKENDNFYHKSILISNRLVQPPFLDLSLSYPLNISSGIYPRILLINNNNRIICVSSNFRCKNVYCD